MLKKFVSFVIIISTVLLLQACSSSPADRLIGTWKIERNGEFQSFVEFTEDRAIAYPLKGDPQPVPYTLIEKNDDRWMVYVTEPSNGKEELFFQGYFKDKNTIQTYTLVEEEDEKTLPVFHRIDDLEKELALARDNKEKEREEKRKQAEKEREDEKKKMERDESKTRDINEKPKEETKNEGERTTPSDNKTNVDSSNQNSSQLASFTQRAEHLQKKMLTDRDRIYPNGQAPIGFTGQYYNEWDALLNDVWQHLKQTLPADQFARVLQEQREWVALKERIEGDAASSVQRAGARDETTEMTETRVFQLIRTAS